MPEHHSRLFSWLNEWRSNELNGQLADIFVAVSAGAPMRRVEVADCIPGQGLAGDRYADGRGHWIKTDGCEVTLITREDLSHIARRSDIDFSAGAHRRNLVVAGIPLAAFRKRQVRIGEVLFEFHRLRPPCGYLDRLVGPGSAKALAGHAGIGLRVISSGRINVGDTVEVINPS